MCGVWMPAYIPGFNFHTSRGSALTLPIYFLNCGVTMASVGSLLCLGLGYEAQGIPYILSRNPQ